MKKEDFIEYFNNKIAIRIVLNNYQFYRGIITELRETTFVLDDVELGEITINYSDVSSPVIPLKKGVRK